MSELGDLVVKRSGANKKTSDHTEYYTRELSYDLTICRFGRDTENQ